jgi:cobalamin biosynthesis Mg chelatase CobN
MQQETLTVGGGGTASQADTQTPQGASNNTYTGARGSAVQPGTAATSLNSAQGGVGLQPRALSTVNLNPTQAQTATNNKPVQSTQNAEFNPLLLIMTLLFIVIAIGMVWAIQRSVKSTTRY